MQTLDVIFYGDSITESWRGIQVGVPVEKFKGIPEIFAKAYGGIKAAVYSISGEALVMPYLRPFLPYNTLLGSTIYAVATYNDFAGLKNAHLAD